MSLPEAASSAASQSQLDQQQIRLLRSLRNGALLPQLLRTYREQAARQIGEIQVAASNANHETLRLAAHTLKSASFSVGATRIGELCAQLEEDARQARTGDTERLCRELSACFQALLPELDAYLAP